MGGWLVGYAEQVVELYIYIYVCVSVYACVYVCMCVCVCAEERNVLDAPVCLFRALAAIYIDS